MILLRCQIIGFGKLAHLDLSFERGLNLVFAPNEGGKSTLQYFLVGLLYGQLRSDIKTQRRLDGWAERFKPWHGEDYGGNLWCKLANGKELEIHRTFGKEETLVQIRTVSGLDVTGRYEQQRNGDVLFAKTHLGIPKDLFESVAVIRENQVSKLNGSDTIRDRIANLAQTGDEGLSVHLSVQKLEDALETIGSERAPTKPYKQVQDRIRALKTELKALEDRRAEFQAWVHERNHYAASASELEKDLSSARQMLAEARWRETARTTQTLEGLESELRFLRQEIAGLSGDENFPLNRLDELNHLVRSRVALEQNLDEIRAAMEPALERLRHVETERQDLSSYASLDSETEAENVTEWFVRFESLSRRRESDLSVEARWQDEIASLEHTLEELGAAFRDACIDWQLKVREAAEEERLVSQGRIALAGELVRKNVALAETRQAITRWRASATISFVLALSALLSSPFLFRNSTITGLAAGAFGLLFLGFSVSWFLTASRYHKSAEALHQEIEGLETDHLRRQEEIRNTHREIYHAMAGSGYMTIEEFLTAAKQSDQLRNRITDLRARRQEIERESERLSAESSEMYARLRQIFEAVGLDCEPASLETEVEVLRKNLRRFRLLDAEYRSCLQKANSLREEEARVASELDQTNSLIQYILNEGGVDSVEVFRERCQERQHLLSLREKEAARSREYQRLSADQTLDQWRARLGELEQQLSGPVSIEMVPFGAQEAEAEERRLAARLAEARENYARLRGRVDQAFQNFRSISEIEEELAMSEQSYLGLVKNRDALMLAQQLLQDLSREQQEVLAPQLNQAVQERFLRIAGSHYREVKIDTDFQVWVREAAAGALRTVEDLSRGTQDQLYFALRFGLLDLVSNGDEPAPGLLDEPFAAYDRVRLEAAFQILKEETHHRQLIIFTCREDVRDLALAHGAHLIQLPA